MGFETLRDEHEKVTIIYELKTEDIRRLDELIKLRMEDLSRQFF